jgi:GDP-mannose 6-dehydrogenase
VDINEDKVRMINAAAPPVVEPGLGELLAAVVGAGRLTATASPRAAVESTDAVLICVGTPGGAGGRPQLDALLRATREIGLALRGRLFPCVVVLRSTVLPGTTERVLIPALRAAAGDRAALALRFAVNPEFMREGSSLRDFARPPFTLVGCSDPAAAAVLRTLYEGVEAPFLETEIRTAEMVKYACNAFHALKVCFANEVGDVCDALGADAQEVMRVFLMDRKLNVSEAYLKPGFAFGGSCLPKDLRALLHAARAADPAPAGRGGRPVVQAGHGRSAGKPDGRARRDPHRQGMRGPHPRPQRGDRPARRSEPPLHRGGDPPHRLAHVRQR